LSKELSRSSSLNVGPGLYLLRYVSSAVAREAPTALVRAQGSAKDALEIVSAPGRDGGEMPGPGACTVLVVHRPTTVEVEISAIAGSSNLDAKFSLDLLDAGSELKVAEPRRATKAASHRAAASAPLRPVEAQPSLTCDVMAHVARRGDVSPDAESWIAGPRAPSAVEGFSIACRGADVGVSAQITTARGRGIWSEWHAPGAFVGSRQQANALTGVRLRLVGADASRFTLDCKALFLGSPVAERQGAEVEFSSFGTSDPVVGLAVRVVAADQATERPVQSSAPPRRSASRVRVFR
jgi:hypothetical protein